MLNLPKGNSTHDPKNDLLKPLNSTEYFKAVSKFFKGCLSKVKIYQQFSNTLKKHHYNSISEIAFQAHQSLSYTFPVLKCKSYIS